MIIKGPVNHLTMIRLRKPRFYIFTVIFICLFALIARTAMDLDTFRYFSCVLGLGPTDTLGRGPDDIDMDRWCNVYSLSRMPRRVISNCVPLPLEPYPLICIHDPANDIFISASLYMGRMWEPEIVTRIREILEEDPRLGFVDIGANIGQFSLLAARMGRHVVAVEAYLRHVEMIHKSIVLNQLEENFTLIYNAVSDEHNTVALSFKKENMGAIRVIESSFRSESMPKFTINECLGTGSHVNTITMDDLLEVIDFEHAIIKLDIEGYEPRVMTQSALLLSRVRIPYIITEWAIMKQQQQEYEVELVNSMLEIMSSHGYVPFMINDIDRLNVSLWHSWPNDVLWKLKRKQ